MPAQRLIQSQNATASAAGTATFIFPAPPTNLVWEGTLSCVAAPAAAIFTATVSGSSWCNWSGASVGGPVQAYPGEVVEVTVTGLTANTSYQLQWICISQTVRESTPKYPDTNAAPATVIAPSTAAILVELPTSAAPNFGQQKVATGGTAVQLTATSTPIVQGVAVQALKGNTDQVYVGITGVTDTHDGTGNGWELQPGQCSPTIPVSNADLLYINSATAGSAVCWVGV